jgi:hypothetical protein
MFCQELLFRFNTFVLFIWTGKILYLKIPEAEKLGAGNGLYVAD